MIQAILFTVGAGIMAIIAARQKREVPIGKI
jgi:hypothetical protein